MRLFIAIALPPDIRRAAADTAIRLRKYGAEGRFVPQENYHITLRFIGESSALSDAAEAMHSAVRDCRPFLLRLGDYGAFSGKAESRTGFVRVKDDEGELARLHETLEAALWERGFDRGRSRLMPHITLGRSITGDAGFACPRNEAFTVQGITLYESRNVRGQMAYTPLHKELFV
ncbi:MAG: RNA 2',3'-cyclic phosphodiesterase [bacterium]|nr:RNA 2',3'-cyclic phosphodiesterase [bacterium]